MKRYKARTGNFMIKTDREAQAIGSYLEKKFPTGGIKPKDLVDAARSAHSPIHGYFEWDDSKAAEKYRIVQARTLIKAVVVIIDDHEVPAYHHVFVNDSKQSSYHSTEECLNTQVLWNQVLRSALDEVESWTNRYRNYRELDPIRASIEKVKENLSNATSSNSAKKQSSSKAASRRTKDRTRENRV